jgi:hypothetical protein
MKIDTSTSVLGREANLLRHGGSIPTILTTNLSIGETVTMMTGDTTNIQCLHLVDGLRTISGIMGIEKQGGGRNAAFGRMVNGYPQM